MAENKFPLKLDWQEGGYRVVVDEKLDSNSSNPVANWVLKAAIDAGGGGGGGGAGEWGSIIGTITDQTDLIQYIANVLDGYYTKTVIYTKNEVDNLLDNKANKGDVYTQAQVDNLLNNKANKNQVYTKTETDSLLDDKANVSDVYVKTDVDSMLNAKADKATTYTKTEVDALIPTVNDATLDIQKNGTSVGTFTANQSTDTTINISVPTSADDIDALPASTKYGASVALSVNTTTWVLTAQLKDQDGASLGTAATVDLPIESVVVSGRYDSATKSVILTLQDGSTIDFSIADLVSGLQEEITADNPLNADLVDDSTSNNKFMTVADREKLDSVEEGANNYVLPTMSTTVKGGAKVGSHLEMESTEYITTNIDVPLIGETATGTPTKIGTSQLADAAVTAAKIDKTSLLNIIYPVGSIYMSTANVSPASFLGGTWARINDRFLLGVGSTYTTVATTGGEATHKLTVNEMPSHRHGTDEWLTRTENGVSGKWAAPQSYTSGNNMVLAIHDSAQGPVYSGYTGGDGAHNNMPPYYTVYMWRRTA